MVSLSEWENRINELIVSFPTDEGKRLKKGVEFAKKAHEGDFRKNTNEPYIVHPYEVCIVASTVTKDVDVLIAALLHDVVEDTAVTLDEVRKCFGNRVAGFVADESEDKMEKIPKAMSWLIRKEKFIDHLRVAPVESKTICLGDKISNLRSTVEQFKIRGDKVWDTFNQKDPKRHEWYYRSIGEAIADDFEGTLALLEYKELFSDLFNSKIHSYKTFGGMKMEVFKSKYDNNNVVIGISGRITSSNADDMYAGIKEIVKQYEGAEYTIDLDTLEMISSAGLRVFLKLKKEKLSFKIINANSDVYDVFDMTGFVQMFDITKAYRKLSVDGYTIIGEGAKGIVYRIDDETILKVYKNIDCMDDIITERECARKALIMGVPTAIPFDIVSVEGRFGSVFELVNANSATQAIIENPTKMESIVEEYADIMREMHSVVDDGSFGIRLPKISDEIKEWAEFAKDYVDDNVYSNIKEYVNSIDESNTLLHGDGHPNNVMCTRDGMIFIDMDTLCTGDAKADIAVVYTALIGYKIADPDNQFLPIDFEMSRNIWNVFIHEYMKDSDEEAIKEVELWCKKFCYLRLFRRGIRKESAKGNFVDNCKKELIKAFS